MASLFFFRLAPCKMLSMFSQRFPSVLCPDIQRVSAPGKTWRAAFPLRFFSSLSQVNSG
jgi:hypothetical protein